MLERLQRELPKMHERVVAHLTASADARPRPVSTLKLIRHVRLQWNIAMARRAPRG
jgi:hypothetical protein